MSASPQPAKRVPAEVFPVGSYIQEEMDERGWSSARLALAMGGRDSDEIAVNQITIELLLAVDDPKLLLGEKTADKLGLAFGVSGKLFLGLDRAYREGVARER